MSDHDVRWDKQWHELLSRCHSGKVEADAGFKSRLLEELKQKTACGTLPSSDRSEPACAEDIGTDEQWSRLFRHAYVPCRPSERFKTALFAEMAARNAILTNTAPEEKAIASMLQQIEPAAPRREFQTRLLHNMKQRQRTTVIQRKSSRRRTIFMSAMSGMAAAAAVLFVVWAQPFSPAAVSVPFSPTGAAMASGGGAVFSTPIRAIPSGSVLAAFSDTAFPSERSVRSGSGRASFADYRVDDVFNADPLPATMRGVDMEINSGDGWRSMDETQVAQVAPGVSFRPLADREMAGLGFGDGTTVHMRPGSMVAMTENGLSVVRGTMTVNVPANADGRFYLHFPAREIAIEPGTMMAVSVASPEGYADGGAPAPVVKVLEGGMAVAKGGAGAGILLANQVYQIDNYVTPDLPGRPLCAAECEEFEAAAFMQPEDGYNPAQLVSADQGMRYRPSPSPVGFTRKGERWVADSYADEPTVVIQYLSDSYFSFASARRDLSVGLSLGSSVILDGGDGTFYEVRK